MSDENFADVSNAEINDLIYQQANSPLHVLLVDDSSISLAVVSDQLKLHGYEVTTTLDAHVALEMFSRELFDIVIVDYEMPGMNGRELMKEMQLHCTLTPVLFLSAHEEDAELAVSLMREGAVDFLTKAKSQDRLIGALRQANTMAFQKKALRQELEVRQHFELALSEMNDHLEEKIQAGQEKLKVSEARMHAVLDAAVDAIISIDLEGRIESFNQSAEKIFGYTEKEMLGQNIRCLMPPPYCDEHGSYLARYIRTGNAKIIGIGREAVAQRKDGTIFPVEVAVSEVHQDAERFFTGFVRDISDHKNAQEVLQQYEELAQSVC